MTDEVVAGGIRLSRNVAATMRDGTVLRADVYRPAEVGVYPTILMRVPYNKAVAQAPVYQHPTWYARHGYNVVIQDCRGRFASDGDFDPLRAEAEDGYDSVEWAARLPESNGRVGMYGFSYAGATQLLAASLQPPALKCCIPAFTASDYFDGWMYERGALKLSFVTAWTVQMLATHDALRRSGAAAAEMVARHAHDFPAIFRQRPLREFLLLKETGAVPSFFEWLEHDRRDEYWQQISLRDRYDDIEVPCLHIGGWYDVFSRGTIENYAELRRRAGADLRREQRLIMGPWIHVPWTPEASGPLLGESFANRIDVNQLQWFDQWLNDGETGPAPRAEYFVMGANEWCAAEAWPPPAAEAELFFDSAGRANSRTGDGLLALTAPQGAAVDVFIYDPGNPVISSGGSSCCNKQVAPMGQGCQAGVESRNEVLLYTSLALSHDIEINGTPRVHLFAATSAADTDWVVRLTEVDQAGRSVNVAQGILRARFRNGLESPALVEPNVPREYVIDMNPTSWRFREGMRIRVQVTSSDFPAHDPNLNTGGNNTSETVFDAVVAIQTVFHDPAHPSRLVLPVTDGAFGGKNDAYADR